ncbi:MAG TPA: AIPR family protein [Trueperaceae bacterium]|nr:AIPR family protein [Trueperaceae bacterium]
MDLGGLDRMTRARRYKMSDASAVPMGRTFEFQADSIRNISSAKEQEYGRRVYVGQAPISSIVGLPTDENVRAYLMDVPGRKKVPKQVHTAIRDTLQNNSDNFSVLNSGVVIVARDCKVDDSKRILRLVGPSIINGSQTQGVIKDYLKEIGGPENLISDVLVKYEVIVTDDEDLIAETSIARNFQNDVMSISIAGRLGQLDELEASLQRQDPDMKLRKSETDLSEDFVATERLLQVTAALVPEELLLSPEERGRPGEVNKAYTYSQKTRCLKDFQKIFESAKDPKSPDHKKNKALYEFYLDVPAQALQLYNKWKTHGGFVGTRIRSIERDDRNRIVEIPDGIIFPILASLSVFAVKTADGWKIQPSERVDEDELDAELIGVAASAYQEIANHNPQTMGKSKACYSALRQITSIYKRLA